MFRNVCGGNFFDFVQVVKDCEVFGVQGIMVYFCFDECYICYSDVLVLKQIVMMEYNIEGYFN